MPAGGVPIPLRDRGGRGHLARQRPGLPFESLHGRGDGGADDPRVVRTEDRRQLWQAQTPQMFRYGVLVRACAEPGALEATDESALVERLAARGACAMPRLVRGSSANLKITWPEDLALAAAILGAQAEAKGDR